MKAHELRIGNLYRYRITDEIDERKSWYELSVIDAEDIVTLEKYPDDEDFAPIELTPEILERGGFRNNGAVYSKGDNCVISLDLSWVGIYSERMGDDIQYDCPKYLHLLQNLVFAVTGKELDVSGIKENDTPAEIKMEESKTPIIYASLTNSAIEKAFIKLNQTLEGLLIEGLKLKGFEFDNNRLQLIDFIKKNCRVEDSPRLQQRIYFVNDIPFFLHNYKATYSNIERSDSVCCARVTFGTYKFL